MNQLTSIHGNYEDDIVRVKHMLQKLEHFDGVLRAASVQFIYHDHYRLTGPFLGRQRQRRCKRFRRINTSL